MIDIVVVIVVESERKITEMETSDDVDVERIGRRSFKAPAAKVGLSNSSYTDVSTSTRTGGRIDAIHNHRDARLQNPIGDVVIECIDDAIGGS